MNDRLFWAAIVLGVYLTATAICGITNPEAV